MSREDFCGLIQMGESAQIVFQALILTAELGIKDDSVGKGGSLSDQCSSNIPEFGLILGN